MNRYLKTSLTFTFIFSILITFSSNTFCSNLQYTLNNQKITLTASDITDFVIVHLSKDGTIKGGYFMSKIDQNLYSLDYPIPETDWDQFRFVYMTNEGQTETQWFDKNEAESLPSDPPETVDNNQDYFPIKIINNTGKSASDICLTMTGNIPDASEKTMAHLDFQNSELIPISLSDNTSVNENCYTYSKKLSSLQKIGDNTYQFNTPHFVSGRLYISIDAPLPFRINSIPNGLAEPTALSDDPFTGAMDIVYDIVEMNWSPDQNLFVNTSNVDFLSIPLKIQMNLFDGTKIIRGYNIPRNEILERATAYNDLLGGCIVRNDTGEIVRLLGGSYGTILGYIPEDYLKPAIDNAWDNLRGKPIDTSFEGWDISGQVEGDDLLHITASHNYFGTENFTIEKFSSAEAFGGDGILSQGSIIEKKIQAFISAAVHRGVFHNSDLWWNNNKYYKENDFNTGLYNLYSKFLHSVSIEGRCYAFSYDDVNGQEPSIWLPNQKELIITIPSLADQPISETEIIAENDILSIEQDSSAIIDILSNDYSTTGSSLSIESISSPQNGTAAITGNHISYTPSSGFYGSDAFSYSVSDGLNTATAIITVTTTKADDNVTENTIAAQNDTATTDQNTAIIIDVLKNDSCSAGNQLSISEVSNPISGTAEIINNKIKYVPNTSFYGSDSFTYTVTNGISGINANVNITVEEKIVQEQLTHSIEKGILSISSQIFNGYVIAQLAKNGQIVGGYFMSDNKNGNFLLDTTGFSDDFWNEYKFVYMTKEGQKESGWYQKSASTSEAKPINENQGTTSELSYNFNNGNITVSSDAITGYIIIYFAKDDNILGGYYMNNIGNDSFTLDYPISLNEWNKLRFIYMTNQGQKESEWITID